MDRDRNLLFGIYAVQLERITPEQLVHAAGEWAADPSRDLAEHLVGSETLCDHDRDFIDWVLQRAIEHYGGDASAVLDHLGREETLHEVYMGAVESTPTGHIRVAVHPDLHAAPANASAAAISQEQHRRKHAPEIPHPDHPAWDHFRDQIRRHKMVAALAIVVAMIVAVGAAYAVLQSRAVREQALVAREEAELLQVEAEAARDTAALELSRAENEKDRALRDALTALRGSMDATRAQLRANPGDLALMQTLAQTYRDIAEGESELGDHGVALAFGERSLEANRELLAGGPANVAQTVALASCHVFIGDQQRFMNQNDAAQEAYRAAIELVTPVLQNDLTGYRANEVASVAHSGLSEVHRAENRVNDALLEAALAENLLMSAMVNVSKADSEVRSRVWHRFGGEYERRAKMHRDLGGLAAELSCLQYAYTCYSEWACENPNATVEDLNRVFGRLSELHVSRGTIEELDSIREKHIDTYQRMVASRPGDAAMKRELANVYASFAIAYRKEGDLDAAKAAYEASLAEYVDVVADQPENKEFATERERVQRRLDQLLEELGGAH